MEERRRHDNVTGLLEANGAIARSIPGYKPRPGQIILANAIAESNKEGGVLVAEAPTGVGKSIAALVALAQTAQRKRKETGKPSVIITSTVALQEQYARRDAPAIVRALPDPLKFSHAILKGRGHYVCRAKVRDVSERLLMKEPQMRDIREWMRKSSTGDRSDLPFDVSDWLWRNASSTAAECAREECPHLKSDCFAETARVTAETSDVVIASYHSAFARIRQGMRRIHVFSDVICDEAHDLTRLAPGIFGTTVSPRSIEMICSILEEVLASQGGLDCPPPTEIRHEANKTFVGLLASMEGKGVQQYRGQVKGDIQVRQLADLIEDVYEASSGSVARLGSASVGEFWAKLSRLSSISRDVYKALQGAYNIDSPGRNVYWVEMKTTQNKAYAVVEHRPYNVSGILGSLLFGSNNEGERFHEGVSLMSATLRTTNGFDFLKRNIGAPPETREMVVSSPFNLAKQGAIVVPRYIRKPPKFGANKKTETEYLTECAGAAAKLIVEMGGRTLCLFASWHALIEIHKMLVASPALSGIQIRKQGDAPTQRLVDDFSRVEESVLLGVASMWQGVDVPGDALKGLFIHKIPFAVPSDPIHAAMGEYLDGVYGEGSSFGMWTLPLATTTLQQGIGRLIRTVNDTGVVVIADQRLTSTGYGRRIMNALPKLGRFRDFDHAKRACPAAFRLNGKKGAQK